MTVDVSRDELKKRIRDVLEGHEGPDNPITMTALHSAVTGEVIIPWRRYDQTRITRALVEELRRDGMAIGHKAGNHGGYFVARNAKELQPTVDWFHGRAMASLKQEATLKRMSPGDVIEQYRIELNKE